MTTFLEQFNKQFVEEVDGEFEFLTNNSPEDIKSFMVDMFIQEIDKDIEQLKQDMVTDKKLDNLEYFPADDIELIAICKSIGRNQAIKEHIEYLENKKTVYKALIK